MKIPYSVIGSIFIHKVFLYIYSHYQIISYVSICHSMVETAFSRLNAAGLACPTKSRLDWNWTFGTFWLFTAPCLIDCWRSQLTFWALRGAHGSPAGGLCLHEPGLRRHGGTSTCLLHETTSPNKRCCLQRVLEIWKNGSRLRGWAALEQTTSSHFYLSFSRPRTHWTHSCTL